MDKYEYKVRADEIKSLIAEGEFAEAVKIADTIDWRRVRSVMMLCTVSDLYKINRRYQESKDILLLAYEKHPSGRAIVYSLCELAIKMEEYIQAVEYYKEFVQIAPRDTGKYVLLYRLYEAQDVSLEERIAVLEEFKKRDYREKWAYELAYLYHRIGLTTKCVEECDEMYLWFGEGKYVLKALELKALHVPLNAEQQEKYNAWIKQRDAALAGEDEHSESDSEVENESEEQTEERFYGEEASDIRDADVDSGQTEESDVMSMPTTELPEVKPVDVGQYNTLNLQMALAESMKEIMTQDEEESAEEAVQEETMEALSDEEAGSKKQYPLTEGISSEEPIRSSEREPSIAEQLIAPLLEETAKMPNPEQDAREILEQIKQELVTSKLPTEEIRADSSQLKYEDVLSQEYDGQIRLVVPDEKVVEKQITGQLSIEDIMAEWEEMKKSNEQKRMEDVRKRILNRTGSLFADFDEATKSGLLEELEKAFVAAIMQDPKKEEAIKKVIHPGETESKPPLSEAAPENVEEVIAEGDEVEELEEIEEPDYTDEAGMLPDNFAADTVAANIAEMNTSETSIAEPEKKEAGHQNASSRVLRELTNEEEELFRDYTQTKKVREQLVNTLDNMSMAAYTGNVIITGEEDGRTIPLAKNLIREMQYNDNNFSGKVAKISASALNKKSVADTLKRLGNGALIIENAADLSTETVAKLNKVLENENIGLLLIIEDNKKRMNSLLADNSGLNECFNLRIDIEPLDDESLVAYAKQYAEENEYAIDEFGVLALHTRIADMQTSDHEVSIAEVRDLVDDAIYYANKKTPKHFVDVLLAKRYDEEDMIILREKDFMHY